jgi:uncharacterized protein
VVGGAGGEPPRGPVADVSSRASALYVGTVRHRRLRPRPHAFRHRTYHVLIDVDELVGLDRDVWGFGYGRRSLTTFHDRDHFGPLDVPVRDKLERWVRAHGRELGDGPLRVLTNLRVLGHVFNPVSWWFSYRRDGSLAMVVAEVNNTFGDAHAYLLDPVEVGADGILRARAAKVFHVSPFLPIDDLDYRFTLQPPGERVTLHMDVHDRDGKVLDATQAGRRCDLDSATLVRTLLRHPLMPLRTVVLIHLHAAVLWSKRVGFHRRPVPPPDGFERHPVVSGSPVRDEQERTR